VITRETPSSLSDEIAAILPKECHLHGKPLPCLDCQLEEQKAENKKRQEIEEQKRQIREKPERLLESFGVGKRYLSYSFANFQGGDQAKAILNQLIESPFDVVLYGGPGVGKTHLTIATIREMVRNGLIDAHKAARFITVPEFLMEIRRTYGRNDGQDEADIIEKHTRLDLLVLDDLGAEQTTAWAITMLYLIIDRRYRDMKPTIITTNLILPEIEKRLSMRIASRMASMRTIDMFAMKDWRKKR
jgi:DNA replication protein DnaC